STAVAIADAGEVVAPLGVVAIIRISGWSIPLIKDGVDHCPVDTGELFTAYPTVNKAAKKQAGAGGDPDGVWHGGSIHVGQSGPVAALNFMRRSSCEEVAAVVVFSIVSFFRFFAVIRIPLVVNH